MVGLLQGTLVHVCGDIDYGQIVGSISGCDSLLLVLSAPVLGFGTSGVYESST